MTLQQCDKEHYESHRASRSGLTKTRADRGQPSVEGSLQGNEPKLPLKKWNQQSPTAFPENSLHSTR
jgi:hypothetical protein